MNAIVHPPAARSPLRYTSWMVAFALLVALLVLFCYEPKGQLFYPRCMLYTLTGWQCPGCGGLRATHQLLHGHLHAALALNPLAVVFWPLAGLITVGHWLPGKPAAALLKSPVAGWVAVSVIVAFGVLRNIW